MSLGNDSAYSDMTPEEQAALHDPYHDVVRWERFYTDFDPARYPDRGPWAVRSHGDRLVVARRRTQAEALQRCGELNHDADTRAFQALGCATEDEKT